MNDEFGAKLLAHFNRPRPTNVSDLATDIDFSQMSEPVISRALEIVSMFTTWDTATGQCPISITDKHWFQKLCGLAEWIAMLEAKIDPEAFAEVEEEPEED